MTTPVASPHCSIWLVDCDRLADAPVGAGLALVPPDEQARSRRLHDPARSRQWLGLRIALRCLIATSVGLERAAAPFTIDPSGRPSIAGGGTHFSITDCGPLALVAIASEAIGVDLEAVRPVTIAGWRRTALEARAMALASGRALPSDPDARFIQAWARLEAVAKATGLGLGRTIGRLEAAERPVSAGAPATAQDAFGGAQARAWPAVRDLEPWHGHRAAIAGSARVLSTIGQVRELDPAQLADMIALAASVRR